MTIKVLTDSCCDLPLDYMKRNCNHVELVGMPIHIDDMDFLDDLGEKTDLGAFYDKIRTGSMASTSQISPLVFEEIFIKNHLDSKETIYIGLSSGLSGTMNNALLAKNMVMEKYPDAKIHIPDIVSASIGQGVLVMHAISMIQKGKASDDIMNWIEENKFNTQHWFAVDNLEYLKNGGRISPAVAKIGTLLNIKPILTVDYEGKLKLYQNIRGRKKSIKFLASKLDQHLNSDATGKVLIGHGNCVNEAHTLKSMISDKVDEKDIVISNLAHTIATHVGPDMLAIAFVGGKREE